MTNFWEEQDQAKSKTLRLLIIFGIAVVSIVLSVYLPLTFIFNIGNFSLTSISWLWSPSLFMWTAVPLLLIIGIGTLIEYLRLRKGGAGLAKQLKARQIIEPENQEERVLVNVIEEMSIASGIKIPGIYLLDDKSSAYTAIGEAMNDTGMRVPGFFKRNRGADGINALVAGNTLDDAAIILTRGCIDHLTRDELQAVVAHEFSHLFNGDMKLNLHVAALVFGILSLAIVGFSIIFPDEGEGGCFLVLLGLPFVILGAIGGFYSKLIQKAVCREREFLADATAVQFTRHPQAMTGVLNKITSGSSRVHIPSASAADHLFFADCRKRSWFSFFRTHPPVEERLKRMQNLSIEGSPEDSPLAEALKQSDA